MKYCLSALLLIWPYAVLADEGRLSVLDIWSWATPPTAKVGAVYLTLRNDGREADRLLGARSPLAKKVEIHQTSSVDGVSRMQQIHEVNLPAGAEVTFLPGGKHFMLIDLARPLEDGERFPVILEFEAARALEVESAVRAMSVRRKAGKHSHHAPTEMGQDSHGKTR